MSDAPGDGRARDTAAEGGGLRADDLVRFASGDGRADDPLDLLAGDAGAIEIDDGRRRPLSEAVADAVASAPTRPVEAVRSLVLLAHQALRAGSPPLAAILTAGARRLLGRYDAAAPAAAPSDNGPGLIALPAGRGDLARPVFEPAAAAAAAAREDALTAAALLNIANAHMISGHDEPALAAARRAMEPAARSGDGYLLAQIALTIVSAELAARGADAAAVALSDAAPIVRRARRPELTASLRGNRGLILARQGRHKEAEQEFRAAVAAARRAGDADKVVTGMQDLAASASDVGNQPLVRRRLRAAVAVAQAQGLDWRLRVLLMSLAKAELRAGDTDAGLAAARRALSLAELAGTGTAAASALVAAAMLAAGDRGRPDDPAHAEAALGMLELALPDLVLAARQPATGGTSVDLDPALHNLVVAGARTGQLDRAERTLRLHLDAAGPGVAAQVLLDLAQAAAADPVARARAAPIALEALELVESARRAWTGLLTGAALSDSPAGAEVAEPVYRAALAAAISLRQDDIALHCSNDLALALTEIGRDDEAVMILSRNQAEAAARGNRVAEVQAAHNLSELARRAGRHRDAARAASRALDLAVELDDPAEIASARVQYGRVLASAGDLEGARDQYGLVLAESGAADSVTGEATAGMASLDLAAGRSADAVAGYRRALQFPGAPLQRGETLLGLCESLAVAGDSRGFRRALGRFVRHVQREGLERLAGSLNRSALAWAGVGRDRLAGETLAISLLLAVARTDPDEEAFAHACVATAVALRSMPSGQGRRARRWIRAELERHVAKRAAATMMRFVSDAAAAVEAART